MPSAIDDALANLRKKVLQIEDRKARNAVIDALRRLKKAITGEVRSIGAADDSGIPW
jgi:hypothetical protein